MNIPQGYKQTELGIIPEDWEVVPLSSLCRLYGRIGFRGYTKADLVHKGEGAITFSPSDIINQQVTYSDCDYISWQKYHESPEIKVRQGDIIFCKTASIGKCAFIRTLPEKATINPQFVVLKDFKCFNEWLYYQLIDWRFQQTINGITGGSTIPTMSQEKLYSQLIACPMDIAEQRAIAEALSDVDGLIAALDKKIAKKRLLKQGAMQQLLTGKKRLPGFTDEWVEKTLGEIGTLSMCKRIFQEETSDSGDVPFYKIGTFGQEADAFISKAKYESYKNMYRFPSKGDILISAAGTIGRTVVYDGKPAYFQDSNIIWLAHTQKHILNIYLSYVYQIINWNIENTTIARLYNDNFNNTVVLFPKSLVEQQAIATILSNMDKEIADLETQRDKYRLLKSGMMQKLLTGQIRLK